MPAAAALTVKPKATPDRHWHRPTISEGTAVSFTLKNVGGMGVMLLTPVKYADHRGFFSEVYNKAALAARGIDVDFIQDNHSLSVSKGTVRGLHFQGPPFAQDKLIRVVAGAIFDVAVDLRRSSPTYGQHVTARLSAKDWNQLLVPAGFAHGFMTLEPDCEVIYKASARYSPEHDAGILWSDPDLGIAWPFNQSEAVVSERDLNLPRFSKLASPFE